MLSNNERNVNSRSATTIGVIDMVSIHRQNETDFHRPLMNMSYCLTFDSGKLWAAEQLDLIATRYLNRSARIVAEFVRQTMSHSQSLNISAPTRPPPPIISIQDTFVVPNVESWSSSSDELPYQTYPTQVEIEPSTGDAATMSVCGLEPVDNGFQNDLKVWDGLP